MLKVEGLAASYARVPVLHEISLSIEPEGIVALLGRNGAGKSTLLKSVMGLVRSSAGSIKVDEREVSSMPPFRRARAGLAYVPQGRDVFPSMTVFENLKIAACAHRRDGWAEEVEAVIEDFPAIKTYLGRAGGELSGGQQQLVALARALVTSPKVLLLDEPSEGIQPSIVDEIAERILAINATRKVTVLLVEQNLNFAARLADRAIVMVKGRIETEMPMAAIVGQEEIQHRYLGV